MKSSSDSLIKALILSVIIVLFQGNDNVHAQMKLGDTGRDVDMLITDLYSLGYLRNDYSHKNFHPHVYNSTVRDAVKHFQRDAGIKEDGIMTRNMVGLLNVWDKLNSTIPLGTRDLTIEDEVAGHDVDELVALLTDAGFPPRKEKLQKNAPKPITADEIIYLSKAGSSKSVERFEQEKIHYIFTEEIRTALMTFQAFNGIRPTGNLDPLTITKLNNYRKR